VVVVVEGIARFRLTAILSFFLFHEIAQECISSRSTVLLDSPTLSPAPSAAPYFTRNAPGFTFSLSSTSISSSPSAPPILEFTLERKFVIRAGFIVPVCEEMEEVAAAKSSNMFTSTILGCSSPVPEMDPELMAPKVVT
jgi:hypothetical protein